MSHGLSWFLAESAPKKPANDTEDFHDGGWQPNVHVVLADAKVAHL